MTNSMMFYGIVGFLLPIALIILIAFCVDKRERDDDECPICTGKGIIRRKGKTKPFLITKTCERCKGTGKYYYNRTGRR